MEARGARVGNIWRTAAHSPATLIHLIRLGNAMLSRTRLDPALRELAVLRVAEILDCDYERKPHTMFGKEVGLTDEKIAAVRDWEKADIFNEVERAVLRFTDEVAVKGRVSNVAYAALARHLDAGMMVELAEVIGMYGMLARILLPFEVEQDSEGAPTSAAQIIGRPRAE